MISKHYIRRAPRLTSMPRLRRGGEKRHKETWDSMAAHIHQSKSIKWSFRTCAINVSLGCRVQGPKFDSAWRWCSCVLYVLKCNVAPYVISLLCEIRLVWDNICVITLQKQMWKVLKWSSVICNTAVLRKYLLLHFTWLVYSVISAQYFNIAWVF